MLNRSALPGEPPTVSDVLLAERGGPASTKGMSLPIFRDTYFTNLRCTRGTAEGSYVCDYDRVEITGTYPHRSLLRRQSDGTWRLKRLTAPARQQ